MKGEQVAVLLGTSQVRELMKQCHRPLRGLEGVPGRDPPSVVRRDPHSSAGRGNDARPQERVSDWLAASAQLLFAGVLLLFCSQPCLGPSYPVQVPSALRDL